MEHTVAFDSSGVSARNAKAKDGSLSSRKHPKNPSLSSVTQPGSAPVHTLSPQASFIDAHRLNIQPPPLPVPSEQYRTQITSTINSSTSPNTPISASSSGPITTVDPAQPGSALRPPPQYPNRRSPGDNNTTEVWEPTNSASSVRSANRGKLMEPVLPCAPVGPAPPTAMYFSKTPITGRIPRGMRAHTATAAGNEIWVIGGCDSRSNCFRDVWKFGTESFIWSKPRVTGDIPPVTRAHSSTLVDGRIWLFGGGDGPTYFNATYYFDTLSLTWVKPEVFGEIPSKRRAHTAVLHDQKIYIFGGGNGTTALNDVYALDVSDISRPTWKKMNTTGTPPVARGYHTMNLVGTKAVVFGGSDGSECFADIHILDIETLEWMQVQTPTQDPNHARLAHTTTCIGSYLFVTGGHDGVQFSNALLVFNLVSLTWENRDPKGVRFSPRGYHCAIMHDSRLLILGGFNGQVVFDECYTLDLAGSAFLPQITNFEVPRPEDALELENTVFRP